SPWSCRRPESRQAAGPAPSWPRLAADRATGTGRDNQFAAGDHPLAVDQQVTDPPCRAVHVLEGRTLADLVKVKDHHIGIAARLQPGLAAHGGGGALD